MLQIGTKVKVMNDDGCYTTYNTFFEQHGMPYKDRYINGDRHICEGHIYTVINMGMHPRSEDGMVYVLEDENGHVYLSSNRYDGLQEVVDPITPDAFYNAVMEEV